MPKLLDTLSDIGKGARVAAETTVWLGRYAKRQYNSSKNGVCLLCNNLLPEGHENTFLWTPSGGKRRDSFAVPGTRAGPTAILALELEGLSPKNLLEARIDPKTGCAVRECKYCRLLCEVFDAFFIDEWMSWVTETLNGMPVTFGLMIRQGAPLIVTTTGFVHDKYWKDARADVEIYRDLERTSFPTFGLPELGPAGPRQQDTRSKACMTFLKDSLWQCCREHADCRHTPTDFKPTRLLYVGGGDNALRLCETASWETPISYIALSHCWGGSTPLSLLQTNLDTFKTHIDISALPNTFRDAVTVARVLGLHYLWIDSLCIIQHDPTDWDKEAAQMANIYQQAFVVITTASSPNPATPILGPREEEWLPRTFNFSASPGVVVPIKARKRHILASPLNQGLLDPPFTNSWGSLKRIGPLYNRGWCFQESYLANRNLHFTPGAIVFECKTHRRGEDQLPPYTFVTPGTTGSLDPAIQWRMIVKSFTSRQLTHGSDKMPAIGGAASTMPQSQSSHYLAGLWSDTLLLDLLWQVMPWTVLSGQESRSLAHDDTEGGPPTWSWASMDWGVVWSPQTSPKIIAKVLDAQTIVNGVGAYGKVSSGMIRLQGRIKRCQLKSNSSLDHDAFYVGVDGVESKQQHYRTDGPLSYEEKPGPLGALVRRGREGPYSGSLETTAAIIFISCSPVIGNIGKQYSGLVLGASPRSPGSMERVGAIFGLPKDWYDSAEEATVIIV